MKRLLAVMCLAALVARSAADTFWIPSLTEPFSVHVMLTKPSSQFRSPGMPMPAKQPLPEYPVLMRQARIVGEVAVSVIVESDGRVSEVKVLKYSQKEFVEPTLDAVKLWRFSPAKEGFKPCAITFEYSVRFDLPDEQ